MKEWLQASTISLFAVFAPIKAIIITVGFLIVMDCITGIFAAMKRGEKISSAALRRTVTKAFVYQSAVITGFLVEVYLIDKAFPINKVVAGLIGVVEFKSILENLNTIHGENLFKSIIEKLGSINDKLNKKD
jgi:hypothetical protein